MLRQFEYLTYNLRVEMADPTGAKPKFGSPKGHVVNSYCNINIAVVL